jgi:hypothetical protein
VGKVAFNRDTDDFEGDVMPFNKLGAHFNSREANSYRGAMGSNRGVTRIDAKAIGFYRRVIRSNRGETRSEVVEARCDRRHMQSNRGEIHKTHEVIA